MVRSAYLSRVFLPRVDSSVRYQSTHARANGIYLLFVLMSVVKKGPTYDLLCTYKEDVRALYPRSFHP